MDRLDKFKGAIGHDSCCSSLDTYLRDARGEWAACDCALDERCLAALDIVAVRPLIEGVRQAKEHNRADFQAYQSARLKDTDTRG